MSEYSAKSHDQSDLEPTLCHYARKTAALDTRTLELFAPCPTATFERAISHNVYQIMAEDLE